MSDPRPGRVRLRPRGLALLVTGSAAVVAGELDAIAALVAAGTAALVLVGLAVLAAVPLGRRAAAGVVPQLAGLPSQAEPGGTVDVVVRVAAASPVLPDRGRGWPGPVLLRPGTAGERPAARALPPSGRRARRLPVPGAGAAAGTSSGAFEIDDPGQRWRVRRRHGVVASAPAGRVGRIGLEQGDPVGHRCAVPVPSRGILEIGPVELWWPDPFGVAEVSVGRAGPWQVAAVVRPGASGADGPAAGRDHAGSGATWRRGAGAGDGSELLELQPLRDARATIPRRGATGDRLGTGRRDPAGWLPATGRLHWPSTLRTGTPMVRRFATPASAGSAVHLDLREHCHTPASVEAAVSAAGDLAAAALGRGRCVHLTATGQPPVRIDPGPSALTMLATWLALADTAPHAGPPGQGGNGGPRPSTVVTTAVGARSWAAPDVLVVDGGSASGGPPAPPDAPRTTAPGTAGTAGRKR